jgi:glycosyltransferase involved in cell wall biosynthesis
MDLLLVVPCYDEAARLPISVFASFLETHPRLGFIFVNDGSRDETPAVLSRLAGRFPVQVVVLDLQPNRGKAEAVRHGLLSAMERSPRLVGFWDADLATPLESIDEFEALLEARPDIEWVIGARVKLLGRHVERHVLRHYLGRVFATAVSLVLGIAVYDTQCGAKLFRANGALAAALTGPFRSRWVFDVEFIGRFLQYLAASGTPNPEDRIFEYPLMTWVDVPGSKVRPIDFVRGLAGLLGVWYRLRRDKDSLRRLPNGPPPPPPAPHSP